MQPVTDEDCRTPAHLGGLLAQLLLHRLPARVPFRRDHYLTQNVLWTHRRTGQDLDRRRIGGREVGAADESDRPRMHGGARSGEYDERGGEHGSRPVRALTIPHINPQSQVCIRYACQLQVNRNSDLAPLDPEVPPELADRLD